MDQPKLFFPDHILIHVGDVMFDFMEPYKPGGRYDEYDRLFMKRVMQALSPAFIDTGYYEPTLNRMMGNFGDPSLIYSDETYDPGTAIKNAYRLAGNVYQTLQMHGAYVRGVFPYMFYDLTPGLAAVFRFLPQLGLQHH